MNRQQSTDRILELNATRNKVYICSISFHALLISSEVHHAFKNFKTVSLSTFISTPEEITVMFKVRIPLPFQFC